MDAKLKHANVAVFFDLDGTLLDTSYLHTFAWWRALDDDYEHVPMSRIHPLIGMGSKELLSRLLGSDKPSISKAHGRYFAGLHEFIRPLPGASELVRKVAAEGARVVIVTSAKERDLPALIGPLACDEAITDVVHGEMAHRSKPSPDLFALALEQSGSTPASTLALGDTVWDIEAAGKAGVACVAVETGGADSLQLKQAGALEVYASCVEILDRWDTTPFARVINTEEMSDKGLDQRDKDRIPRSKKRLVS